MTLSAACDTTLKEAEQKVNDLMKDESKEDHDDEPIEE